MAIAIVILNRSVSLPKEVWRLPSTERTLRPLALEALLPVVLQAWSSASAPALLIESDIAADGSEVRTQVPRPLKDTDWAGVFALSVVGEKVKLQLSQEACMREVYTPRRRSQHLATLRPWEPARVILNGKADWPSGRRYYILEYSVTLCDTPRMGELLPVRNFDLQADLI